MRALKEAKIDFARAYMSPVSRPTLKTIAAATGFAVMTVSRALADDPKIALATRVAVKQAARDLNYYPDRAAQRLRTGRTKVICLVLSAHDEIIDFRSSMIAGLEKAISGTDYHISMTPYDLESDPLQPIMHIVRNRLADGLVFAGTEPLDPRVEFLLKENFPFITYGRTDIPGHDWVDYDNEEYSRLCIRRLHARNRRNIVLIPPDPSKTYHRHMLDGFCGELMALGLKGEVSAKCSLSSKADFISQYTAHLVSQSGSARIDGLICPGEVATMAAMAAISDAGLTVGEDIDVLAKQTSKVFDFYRPRIDSVFEDIRGAGQTLGQMLLRKLSGELSSRFTSLQLPVPIFRLDHS